MSLTDVQKKAIRDACIKARDMGWTLQQRLTMCVVKKKCCAIGAYAVVAQNPELYDFLGEASFRFAEEDLELSQAQVFSIANGFDDVPTRLTDFDPDSYNFGVALRKEFVK